MVNVVCGMVNMQSGGMSIYSDQTTLSLLGLQKQWLKYCWKLGHGGDIEFRQSQHPYGIDRARTELVKWCQGEHPQSEPPFKVDSLLMLDTDMHFPIDIIPRLVRHEKRVVSGFYISRHPPFKGIAFNDYRVDVLHPETKLPYFERIPNARMVDAHMNGELLEIWGTGFGAVLLDMKIFDELSEPWFYKEDGQQYGEDIYFYDKLHKELPDVKVYMDASALIQHLAMLLIPFDLSGMKYNQEFDIQAFRKRRRDFFER